MTNLLLVPSKMMSFAWMCTNLFVFVVLLVLSLSCCNAFVPISKSSFLFSSGVQRNAVVTNRLSPATIDFPLSTTSSQILCFQEPQTNVTVILIGAMHYNPKSIQLAYDTIQQLGLSNSLGSVILEQCDIRWNKTNEIMEQKPFFKQFLSRYLNNEMRKACNVALEYKVPIILGDQRINLTSIALKETLDNTLEDITTPIVGWKRYYKTLRNLLDEVVPLGVCIGKDGTETPYLNIFSFIDARLWIAAPISFIKYPLSFLVRNPLTTSIVITILVAFDAIGNNFESYAFSQSANQITDVASIAESFDITSLIFTFGIFILEILLFSRLLLQPLLAERNIILARNILEQCKLYQGNEVATNSKVEKKQLFSFDLLQFLKSRNQKLTNPVIVNNAYDDESQFEIVYVPEMINAGISKIPVVTKSDKVVVAVLGMAHCNGIMKLLKEERTIGETSKPYL